MTSVYIRHGHKLQRSYRVSIIDQSLRQISHEVTSDVILRDIQNDAGRHILHVKKRHRHNLKQNFVDLQCNRTIIEPWVQIGHG